MRDKLRTFVEYQTADNISTEESVILSIVNKFQWKSTQTDLTLFVWNPAVIIPLQVNIHNEMTFPTVNIPEKFLSATQQAENNWRGKISVKHQGHLAVDAATYNK